MYVYLVGVSGFVRGIVRGFMGCYVVGRVGKGKGEVGIDVVYVCAQGIWVSKGSGVVFQWTLEASGKDAE